MSPKAILTTFIASILTIGVLTLSVWPRTYVWAGDGNVTVRATGMRSQPGLHAAMIATRHQWVFGIKRHFSYIVQQIDWPGGTYTRLTNCHLQGGGSVSCRGQSGIFYVVRVTQAPSYQQNQDDDGVNVTGP